jgi:hypothetical protein
LAAPPSTSRSRRVAIAFAVVVVIGGGILAAVVTRGHHGAARPPATGAATTSTTARPGATLGTTSEGVSPTSAYSVSAALGGPVRSVTDFLGFNGENTREDSAVWLDPVFYNAVHTLQPESIRLFGGTTANFWNWQNGTFTESASFPGIVAGHPVPPIPLTAWADAVKAGAAVPVFDLNVLTSTLSDQLAMLHAAAALGLPIRWVELGNELYVKAAVNRQVFPTGAAYGQLASTWIPAIKAAFPGVRVAICGYSYLGGNNTWNSSLLSTVRGEDAITFHTYWNPAPRGGSSGATPLDDLLVSTQRRFANLVNHDLPVLPSGVTAWVTEWNIQPNPSANIGGTWAAGLSQVLYAMDLLSAPQVELTDNHALAGWTNFAAIFGEPGGPGSRSHSGTPLALTADGVAFTPLLAAMHDHSQGQPLVFSADPILITGVRAIYGWSFGKAAALLNLSGATVTVSLPGSLANLPARQVTTAPMSRVSGPASMQVNSGVDSGSVVLAPYSVTALG